MTVKLYEDITAPARFGDIERLWLPDGKPFNADSAAWVTVRTSSLRAPKKFEVVVWPPSGSRARLTKSFDTLEDASEFCFAQWIALKLEGAIP